MFNNKVAPDDKKSRRGWEIAARVLLVGWITTAALSMWRLRGGFVTNYGNDLLFPPYCYIFFRGLSPWKLKEKLLLRRFGRSPGFAAVSIFLVGLGSEMVQGLWPQKFITGTFDPWDIAAYALGLGVCYVIDSSQLRRARK